MVEQILKKYKCVHCGKNFTQNIGLKLHITAAHEKKMIVMNVVKFLLKNLIWKWTKCSWKHEKKY